MILNTNLFKSRWMILDLLIFQNKAAYKKTGEYCFPAFLHCARMVSIAIYRRYDQAFLTIKPLYSGFIEVIRYDFQELFTDAVPVAPSMSASGRLISKINIVFC